MSKMVFTYAALQRAALLSISLGLLAGCSTLQGDKVDYKSSGRGVPLEVPPDLTALSRDTRYTVPGGAVTASGFAAGQTTNTVPVAAGSVADVRAERDGSKRWLVASRSPEQLYPLIRDFWQENGFLLAQDQPNLGIIETDWAENRAKLPQDFIRSTLGKAIDALYDTGERDKFRTRLERSANGTEIYVTHRGMVEKIVGGGTLSTGQDRTVWEPRPSDPELEAEFLRRLMVKLGVAQEAASAQIAGGVVKATSRVATVGGVPVVQVDEGFDRAWRRVGLALDRTGFTVEDRDRAQGIYFVRYVEPKADTKEPGFFGRIFGSSTKEEPPLKFRIAVKGQSDASTVVSVLTAQGQPESSANAQRIVKVIADDLR
jgi:outer membrane protein assembly factor BamC